MKKLLNGKELDKAFAELQVYKKPSGDKQGNAYYKVEDYALRMDEVLGRDGYRVLYDELNTVVLPTNQVILSVKCRIEFLAEDESVLFVAEGYGTYEVIRNKERTAFINLSTAGVNANVNAFKAACKEFSIFGCRSIEKPNGNTASDGNRTASNSGSSNNKPYVPLPIKTVSFFLKKPLVQFWKDRDGKPGYRMIAQEIVDGKFMEKECEILFYPNQYKKETSRLNDLIGRSANTSAGFRVTLGVSEVAEDKKNADYSSSYIFKRFGEGA